MRNARVSRRLVGILVLATAFVVWTPQQPTPDDNVLRSLRIGMNGIAAKKAFSLLPRLSGGRRWNVRGESFHEDYKIGSSSEKLLQVEYEWGITQGHTLPWRLANWSIGPPTPKPRLEDVVKQLHIGMTMREARTLLSPCSPSVGEGNARHWRDIYDLGSTLELMYEFGGGGYCVDKWKVGDREYPTP